MKSPGYLKYMIPFHGKVCPGLAAHANTAQVQTDARALPSNGVFTYII